MILDETLSKAVTARTAAEAIDSASKAQRKLESVFGEHTFFSSDKGLFIVEPAEDPERPNHTLVRRIRLATWADRSRRVLKPIKETPKAKRIAI